MSLPVTLVVSLALTLAVELPLLCAFGLRGKELVIGVLVNVMTNPPVVFAYNLLCAFTEIPRAASLAVLETAAFLAEGAVFKAGTELKRPFLVSLAVNGISFSAGLMISLLIRRFA